MVGDVLEMSYFEEERTWADASTTLRFLCCFWHAMQ